MFNTLLAWASVSGALSALAYDPQLSLKHSTLEERLRIVPEGERRAHRSCYPVDRRHPRLVQITLGNLFPFVLLYLLPLRL